ncbi:hypothetical protein CGZ94_17965 [Enemella evansiae]|uniref:DUF309 domain-containing protein n=1 Tax=Enemella evansiae TaxID=2016499 RepID=A0A255G1D1_9ACTN|nr:hypothetical protein CGZ94_17965 [Enemella evansiae]
MISGASGSRDRDEQGRARNARPRDGLGRPLPHGAEGVPRLGEGVIRSPRESLSEASEQLLAGRPFHAHEVFEDAWKSRPDSERELWKPLAQLMVALTHAARGNATGADRLRQRSLAALAAYPDPRPYGLDLAAVAELVAGLPPADLGTPATFGQLAEVLRPGH